MLLCTQHRYSYVSIYVLLQTLVRKDFLLIHTILSSQPGSGLPEALYNMIFFFHKYGAAW